MRYALLVGLAALASGCAPTTKITPIKDAETPETVEQRNALIGRWLGQARTTDGRHRQWIVERSADCTYRIDFRLGDGSGDDDMHTELGIWGTSAGIYFTATRAFLEGSEVYPASTTDPALYDVYRIISLTSEWFEYENLSTRNRFKVRRLAPGDTPATRFQSPPRSP